MTTRREERDTPLHCPNSEPQFACRVKDPTRTPHRSTSSEVQYVGPVHPAVGALAAVVEGHRLDELLAVLMTSPDGCLDRRSCIR